jgi:hypothetical protein|tara:strand:- start:327 stop:599 length:273 start_codon:yes stop_codon:yes gene_type:complete
MKNTLRIGAALMVAGLLSGCGTVDAFKVGVRNSGARAYDSALDSAVYFQCEAASAGAVRRMFAANEDLWEAWKTTCGIAIYNPTKPSALD